MSWKRFFVVMFAILWLCASIVPSFSYADTSITGKTDCPAGSSTVDPSGQQTFGAGPDAASGIQAYIYKAESCASACFDENVAIQVGIIPAPSVTVVVKATNQCGATPITQPAKAQPPRGCSTGQTQPQITLEVPDITLDKNYLKQQTIGPKSRCYGAVATTVSTLTQGGISSNTNPAAIQSNFDSLNSLGTQAPTVPSVGTVAGNAQLISALTTSGVNANDAQKIAADPTSAQALINAYATGNKDTIQDTVQDAAAKAGISLNDGVYDNIASLSASKLATAQTALSPLADQSGTVIASDTFEAQSPPGSPSLSDGNVCGFSGIAGRMMNSETRCGSLQAPVGQSAQGPLQYQCATWTAYANASGHGDWSDCSNRYDVTKAVQVTNDYYQNVWLPQNASTCAAANISIQSCAYTSHWLGTGGGPALIQSLPNLDTSAPITSLCGTATLSQAACDQNPGLIYADPKNRAQPYTIAGVFQHMDSLLGVSSAAPTTYAGTSYMNTSLFASITGPAGSGNPIGLSSPFANVSPYYITPGLGSSQAPTPPPLVYSQGTQPTQATSGSASSQTPLGSGQTGAATAQIITQSASVQKGNTIPVSWSSVGMSAASPCRVLENGSALAPPANQGFQVVTASTTGTDIFSISCTAQGTGAIVTGSATVVVHS